MAVYTDVAAEELAQFLAGYDIGELLSYKGIAEGVENSNFLVHTSHGSFILTLYEKRVAANDLQPDLEGLLAKELAEHERSWPRGLPEGVIHADLFPDNVFFLGDKLSGLIDFYFACTDALAYDVAVCLNAWCFETDHSYNV